MFSCSWYLITLPPNYTQFVLHPCHIKTIALRCALQHTLCFSMQTRLTRTFLISTACGWLAIFRFLLTFVLDGVNPAWTWSWGWTLCLFLSLCLCPGPGEVAIAMSQSKNLDCNGPGPFREPVRQELTCSIGSW